MTWRRKKGRKEGSRGRNKVRDEWRKNVNQVTSKTTDRPQNQRDQNKKTTPNHTKRKQKTNGQKKRYKTK